MPILACRTAVMVIDWCYFIKPVLIKKNAINKLKILHLNQNQGKARKVQRIITFYLYIGLISLHLMEGLSRLVFYKGKFFAKIDS